MHGALTDSIICVWQQKRDVGFWRPFQAISGEHDDAQPGHHAAARLDAARREPAVLRLPQRARRCDVAAGRGDPPHLRRGHRARAALADAAGPRTYARLSEIEHEAFHARIWGGLHYRKAMTGHLRDGARHGGTRDGGPGLTGAWARRAGRVHGDGVAARPAARGGPASRATASVWLKMSSSARRVLVPGPGQLAAPRRTPCPAGLRPRSRQCVEPLVVVRDQLVDAGVRATARPARAPAAGAGPASRAPWPARPGSRASGCSASTGSKPIDGVIVGSTWSPANSSPAARSAKT